MTVNEKLNKYIADHSQDFSFEKLVDKNFVTIGRINTFVKKPILMVQKGFSEKGSYCVDSLGKSQIALYLDSGSKKNKYPELASKVIGLPKGNQTPQIIKVIIPLRTSTIPQPSWEINSIPDLDF